MKMWVELQCFVKCMSVLPLNLDLDVYEYREWGIFFWKCVFAFRVCAWMGELDSNNLINIYNHKKKSNCMTADCLDPSCSGHGTCVNGQCYCKAGWQGDDCAMVDQQVYQCLPGCSEHGTYDLETGTCVCDRHWTGPDCSQGMIDVYTILSIDTDFGLIASGHPPNEVCS